MVKVPAIYPSKSDIGLVETHYSIGFWFVTAKKLLRFRTYKQAVVLKGCFSILFLLYCSHKMMITRTYWEQDIRGILGMDNRRPLFTREKSTIQAGFITDRNPSGHSKPWVFHNFHMPVLNGNIILIACGCIQWDLLGL